MGTIHYNCGCYITTSMLPFTTMMEVPRPVVVANACFLHLSTPAIQTALGALSDAIREAQPK